MLGPDLLVFGKDVIVLTQTSIHFSHAVAFIFDVNISFHGSSYSCLVFPFAVFCRPSVFEMNVVNTDLSCILFTSFFCN